MKKIYDLDEWRFIEKVSDKKRNANVRVYLKYINLKKVVNLTPRERVIAIDKYFKEIFSRLLKTGMFDTYQLIGTKKRPRGIDTTVLFKDIKRISKNIFIENIFINSVTGGKKIKNIKQTTLFCIKMTVAIQIENIKNGLQTYEERYVLIKAKSSNEAYKKIKTQKKKYEEPYLNSQGRLVRWEIESLDDCYETDFADCEDLNNPKGFEVFSILKKRKLTKDRCWNGKTE
jgi:Domain of unknown function (DUF4288)